MFRSNSVKTYTASEARKQFHTLVKKVGEGKKTFEIIHRGSDPVLLISKSDIESLLETLDILDSPEEIQAIRAANRETTIVSHKELIRK